MTIKEIASTLKELMQAYDDNRAKWIAEFGSDAGFNEWFTNQVIGGGQ